MYINMFGGFIGSNQEKGADWGENILNTVASNTIRHLFTRSEAVDVEVRCQPSSKLLQGSIDSFKMSGRGLVIRKDFRTAEMSFETDAVSIDFSSVLKGKISLKQPTQAIAMVKLSETDINDAFKAELVRKRLENLSIPALDSLSEGKPMSFTDVSLELLPQNHIKLFAQANLSTGVIPVSLSCQLEVLKRRRIKFANICFEADGIESELQAVSETLTYILGDVLNEMVDLDRFNLDGVSIRLNRLETEGKYLLFTGYAQIEHFPHSG
jgi:hypothetical protein